MYTQQNLFRKNSFQTITAPAKSEILKPNQYSSLPKMQSTVKFRRRSLKMKNIRVDQQKNQANPKEYQNQPNNAAVQLRFLTDLIRRKQQSIEIKTIQDPQPKKNLQRYQYYDSIVRDLISQIRTRNNKESISPQKLLVAKLQRNIKISSPRRDKIEPSQIKLQSNKDKMIFSLNLGTSDAVYQKKITSFIQFLYKVNFSNGLYVDLSLSKPKLTYKVKVGLGNNGLLIKSLIKRRFWIEITTGNDYQFLWTQNTDFNLHQNQDTAQNKTERPKTRPPKMKKLLANTEQQNLLKIMKKQEIGITNEWYQRSDLGKLSCFSTVQIGRVSNHIPLNCIIGAKRILFKVMYWFYFHLNECDPFRILPKTYSFQNTETSTKVKDFIQQYKQTKQVWIVKPGQNTNRGNGIKVVQTKELISIINRQKNKGADGRPLIVQQYLRPFLYCGRKFDIRHYLFVTSCNGYIRGYWYKEGYIRTSSQKYDLEDLSDEMVHLTNDAVQKRGEHYGKYQQANKVSYSQFQRYLDTAYPHKHFNFQNQIIQKMKEITADMMKASFQFMDPHRKKHNFELYGLDFFVSSKFKPYLIECNANPCLQINCPILEKIIPGAVQHALRIGLDPLFPPPQHYPPSARYQLCDRVIDRIKYELIFDQKIQGPAIRQKTKNCSIALDLSGLWLRPDQDIFEDEGQQLTEQAALD